MKSNIFIYGFMLFALLIAVFVDAPAAIEFPLLFVAGWKARIVGRYLEAFYNKGLVSLNNWSIKDNGKG